jgi:hypothetical protein
MAVDFDLEQRDAAPIRVWSKGKRPCGLGPAYPRCSRQYKRGSIDDPIGANCQGFCRMWACFRQIDSPVAAFGLQRGNQCGKNIEESQTRDCESETEFQQSYAVWRC